MSADTALQKALSVIPDCVAGGIVDLSTGMLLAIKTVDSHPNEVMDILAAATADLFQGANVQMIEAIFKKARGITDTSHHYFQEVIVNSDNLVHIFSRGKKNPEHVVAFVCRRSVNLGMAITKVRASLPDLESAA